MSLTDAVVIALIVLAVVYEVYTLANERPFDTISETVWRISFKRPIVPFAAGLVCGHFWWLPERCAALLSR